jgi:uncharacterized protein
VILQELSDAGLITPPKWLPGLTCYLATVGSESYGCALEASSDVDLQGICVPPQQLIFPHLVGEIAGFGHQIQRFEGWQQHAVITPQGDNFDLSVFGIVRFFQLAMDNNPNIVDVINVPACCVRYENEIGVLIRQHRQLFFHKGCYHKFRGYSAGQINKLKSGRSQHNSKRSASIQHHGYDTKFVYHACRLLLECEQILTTGDLTLDQHSSFLLEIRQGLHDLDQLLAWIASKEKDLTMLYENSTAVPAWPRVDEIKALLIKCVEMQWGSTPGFGATSLPSQEDLM